MAVLVLADATCTECGCRATLHDGKGLSWCSSECQTRTLAWSRPLPRQPIPEPALPRLELTRASCCGAWTTDGHCTLHQGTP
jgi:hypothetical protein